MVSEREFRLRAKPVLECGSSYRFSSSVHTAIVQGVGGRKRQLLLPQFKALCAGAPEYVDEVNSVGVSSV